MKTRRIPNVSVKLVRESRADYTPVVVFSPLDASEFLSDLKELPNEQFVVLHLNTRHEIIGRHVLSSGGMSSSLVDLRLLFQAVVLSNAAGILVAHNHPSGDPTPSGDDINVTKQLVKACELMGVNFLDHLVIGDTVVSIRETNSRLWN